MMKNDMWRWNHGLGVCFEDTLGRAYMDMLLAMHLEIILHSLKQSQFHTCFPVVALS